MPEILNHYGIILTEYDDVQNGRGVLRAAADLYWPDDPVRYEAAGGQVLTRQFTEIPYAAWYDKRLDAADGWYREQMIDQMKRGINRWLLERFYGEFWTVTGRSTGMMPTLHEMDARVIGENGLPKVLASRVMRFETWERI